MADEPQQETINNFSHALSQGNHTHALAILSHLSHPPPLFLHLCIIHEQAELLRYLLKTVAPDRQSILLAAQKHRPDFLSIILSSANTHKVAAEWLDEAVHAAVWSGSEQCVRLLVERGVGVEARGGDGATPLVVAVVARDVTMVELLLNAGGDTDAHWRGRSVHEWARGVGGDVWEVVRQLRGDKGVLRGGGLIRADVSVGVEEWG